MEDKFYNEKVIVPKSNKKVTIAMIWNLTWVQVVALTLLLILGATFLVFVKMSFGYIVLVIVVLSLLSFLFLLTIQGKVLYQYFYIWHKWQHRKKSSALAITKENNSIKKINDKYIAVFKLNAESINFLSETDQRKLLNNFWNIIKEVDNGSFIKIPADFDFESYNRRLANVDKKFVDQENKIINSFKATKNINRFYFVVHGIKEDTVKTNIGKVVSFLNSSFIQFEKGEYQDIANYFDTRWSFNVDGFKNSQKNPGFIYQVRDMSIENNFFYLKDLFSTPNAFVILNYATIAQNLARKQLDNVVNKINYNLSKTFKSSDEIESNKIYSAVQLQLDSIVDNSDKFKNINLYAGCIGKSNEDITQAKASLINVCNSLNFKLDKFKWEQDITLINALSFNNVIDRNSLNMTAKTLAAGYFLDKNQLNDENGYLLGSDNQASPVFLDIFKITKRRKFHNAILFGTPGSGKTTLLLKMLKWQHEIKTKIFLIDVEDEYSEWVKSCGGELIDLAGGKATINPLEIFAEEDQSFIEYLAQHLIDLDGFITMLEPTIPKQEKEYILNVIHKMYRNLLMKHPKNPKWFTFSDVDKECKKNKVMYERVYFYLDPLITRYGKYWNKPTNINIIKNNLICARLQDKSESSIDMPDSVLSIQISLITRYINKLIFDARHSKNKCLIVLDEAHKLVSDNNEFILMYLSNLAKRVRKYNTGLILATQNISDFISAKNNEKYFANIFKCMQYFFFGGMHAQDITALDTLLKDSGGITESQKAFLTTAEKGQFILQVDNTNFIDLKVKIAEDVDF